MPEEAPTDTKTDKKPPRQRFSEFVAQHRNGLADDELSVMLEEMVDAIGHSMKKNPAGSLTIKLKFRGEGDMIAVLDTVTSTLPDETEPRVYFVGTDGGLTRTNPLQPSLLGNESE